MKTRDNAGSAGKNMVKGLVILGGLAVMTACGPTESEDEAEAPAEATEEVVDEAAAPPPATDEAAEETPDATPSEGDQSQGRDPTTGSPG